MKKVLLVLSIAVTTVCCHTPKHTTTPTTGSSTNNPTNMNQGTTDTSMHKMPTDTSTTRKDSLQRK